jgi:hypothetical protein
MEKPKYQIGDRVSDNIIVRGVMTTSKGKHRYFLQIFDGSLVSNEEDLEESIDIAKNHLNKTK